MRTLTLAALAASISACSGDPGDSADLFGDDPGFVGDGAPVAEPAACSPGAELCRCGLGCDPGLTCASGLCVALPGTEAAIALECGTMADPSIDAFVNNADDARSIEGLELTDGEVETLDGIECLASLRSLIMYRNEVRDAAPLAGLLRLVYVNLSENNMARLDAFSELRSLQSLDVGFNRVDDLTPLVGLANLKTLTVAHNQISDLTPLLSLPSLEHVTLIGNPISCERQAPNLSALRTSGVDVTGDCQ